MKKWVKLFEVEGQQVLFFLEPDGDDMRLHQCVHNEDGTHIDVALVFPNDAKDNSRKAFDMVDEAVARNVLKLVRDLLADDAEDAEASLVAEAEESEEA